MSKKELDFIVIGATKSGTTTLFYYLAEHPRIFLPPVKEAVFFSHDDWYARGWAEFRDAYYSGASADRLWGKVTPTYMHDARVAGRTRKHFTGVKLIAVLRNPIERALSWHRNRIREGRETRTFEEMARAHFAKGSSNGGEPAILHGEYGRILSTYESFRKEGRLLVVFTETLERSPQAVLDETLRYLDLSDGFKPSKLGKRYNVGGTKQRFPGLVPRLSNIALLRRAWHLVPRDTRSRAFAWFKFQVNTRPSPPAPISPALRRELADHYRPDVRALVQSMGRGVPWAADFPEDAEFTDRRREGRGST
jgi:hypothetical protein